MPSNIFQVYVIDARAIKIRPPKVCDISPGTIGAVYNFVGLEAGELANTIRNGEVWDAAAAGKVLAGVPAEKAVAAAKG
jgi:hypothetical protein